MPGFVEVVVVVVVVGGLGPGLVVGRMIRIAAGFEVVGVGLAGGVWVRKSLGVSFAVVAAVVVGQWAEVVGPEWQVVGELQQLFWEVEVGTVGYSVAVVVAVVEVEIGVMCVSLVEEFVRLVERSDVRL